MNSLRMSFWIVPDSTLRSCPCSSPATMKLASTGITAPFIVIETETLSSGMPSKRSLHVLDRIDGDASLADIALDPRVIAVIAAMGGKVEGDRHALLTRGQRLRR